MIPIIRPADADDIEAITAIYADAVLTGTGTFELAPPDADEMAARRSRIEAAGCPFLVASSSEGVLGYAYAGPFRDRPAYRFTLEDSVYVRRDQRGLGVGRVLLGALVDSATAGGWRQMLALVGDGANAASIALHVGAGFTHAGVLHAAGWKAGRWLDVIVMQRALGCGSAQPPL